MRKQTKLLSLVAAVIAATGVTAGSAAASESASLDCYSDYYGSEVSVYCDYNGFPRGYAVFDAGLEPERLWVMDTQRDGRGVTAYIRRTSDGKVLAALRDASGGGATQAVYIAEGTAYTIQVCLDGAICGPRYTGRA